MNDYINKLNAMQEEASNSLIEYKISTCQIHTGGGKWFVSFKAILKLYKEGLLEVNTNILVLAETSIRELSLHEELDKFNEIYNVDLRNLFNFKFQCYQTVYKWVNRYFKLVIADEIHSSLTPSYHKFYINNEYEYLFGLTATPELHIKYEDFVSRKELFNAFCPIKYKYDLVAGSKGGTVRNINIYIIQHQLNNKDKTIKAGNKKVSWLQTEFDAYNYANKQVNIAMATEPKNSKELKNKESRIYSTLNKRSGLLYNLESKIPIVKYLTNQINEKILIFGTSIKQLTKFSPVVSVKNSADKNKLLIDMFNEDEIDCIGSFKMLQQGISLNNLGVIIFHSYYSTQGKFEQMLGRLRFSDNTGNIFIIQTMNTQEVVWVRKMLKNIKLLDGFNFNINHCANAEDAINKYNNER